MDQEGNAIPVGYEGYIAVKAVAVLSNGVIVWQGGYSGDPLTTLNGTDVHKNKGSWPAL